MRNLLALRWNEWKDLELQIEEMNDEGERIASSDAARMRLRQIPGIGPLVATAIVAAIGNGAAFHKGREFAAWLGIVPRQYSTGGNARLYRISKRGNNYLRKILMHGARAVVLRSKRDRIAMGAWMTAALELYSQSFAAFQKECHVLQSLDQTKGEADGGAATRTCKPTTGTRRRNTNLQTSHHSTSKPTSTQHQR